MCVNNIRNCSSKQYWLFLKGITLFSLMASRVNLFSQRLLGGSLPLFIFPVQCVLFNAHQPHVLAVYSSGYCPCMLVHVLFAEWKMASLFKLKGDAMPNGKKCSSCDIKFANPSFCAGQIWRGCSQCLNTGPLLTVSRVSWNMHAWLRGMICLVFANRIYKRNTVVVDFSTQQHYNMWLIMRWCRQLHMHTCIHVCSEADTEILQSGDYI